MNILDDCKYLETFAGCTGKMMDKEVFEKKVRNTTNVFEIAPILSQLASVDPNNAMLDAIFKKDLIDFCEKTAIGKEILKARLRGSEIFAPHRALFLLKYIFVLSQKDEYYFSSRNEDYTGSLLLSFYISDYVREESYDIETFREYSFYLDSRWHHKCLLGRLVKIFIQIARDTSVKGYIDLDKAFYNTYKYTIE